MSSAGRGGAPWAAASLALALLAAGLWFAPRESLDWQPTRAVSEPWRAWSAAFVHWNAMHLTANLAGCVVVALFGAAARVPVRATVVWMLAWPLTHAALWLQPALASYGGLSGVLHAGVAIAAWHLLRCGQGHRRWIGMAVLVGLGVKLMLERPWLGPTQAVLGWDIPLAPSAHVAGALAGLLCAALADAMARWRR